MSNSVIDSIARFAAGSVPAGRLKPGGALDYTAAHTFLFAGRTNQSTGDFTYYAESNPRNPAHGPTRAGINSSSLEGWPTSHYTALRYNNIVDDVAPSQPAKLRLDFNGDGTADIAGKLTNGSLLLWAGNGDGSPNTSSGYAMWPGTGFKAVNPLIG
ncbi:hypothetical protein ACF9IK_00490 [Kitasatospora hibisci]|uniref:hypothetical protein n=1 Tax=Kitasatospora hibisci TaxID=3369522 RepID=UPI003754AB66